MITPERLEKCLMKQKLRIYLREFLRPDLRESTAGGLDKYLGLSADFCIDRWILRLAEIHPRNVFNNYRF
jgi:hypothetical protein